MRKNFPLGPISLTERENKPVPMEEPLKPNLTFGGMQEKLKVRSKIVQDLEAKMKHFLKNQSDPKAKSEMMLMMDRLEEEIVRNQKLEFDVCELKNENKTLGEIIDRLREQVELQNPYMQNEKVENMQNTIENLQKQIDDDRYKVMNFDQVKRELEEAKKERDRAIIEMEKCKAVLESKIQDLKEQIERKDQRIENRITDEHHNKTILKDGLHKALEHVEKWKKLYMMEAQTVISLQNQYKSVLEDNKTHLHYIAQLETRLSQTDQKYFDLYAEYHEKLTEYRIENIRNIQSELDFLRSKLSEEEFKQIENNMMIYALQSELNKEKEKSLSLKTHLDQTLQVKGDLETNLAVARTNVIEATERLEEEVAKVAAIEDMRIQDLHYIVSLEREI